jgi:ABC-2 type transport system ATP-binding protein
VEPNVIELTNLTKKYGSYTAVDSLNLTIRKGEIFGLLGPNGAGKSTTILMMLGLTDPTSGTVSVCGINSTSHPMEVKRKVGYLPEDVGFYDDRTGFENLIYTARLNRISLEDARARAQKLLVRVGLGHETSKKTGKYSRGMRQRLGLADVLIKDPEIIILDEPTSGIDPNGVREFMDLIVQLSKEEGITVLFSSHHLHQVQQVCDRVGLFVGGKLLAEGDIFTLSEQVFAGEPLLVEVGYVPESKDVSKVQDALRIIDGVIEVWQENDLFRICCSKDITPVIAKTVIDAGIPLVSLNKKEYGLDDIYNRYFEGGNNE